ncbi:hypothetical protein FAVG1_12252 [Fusarium avenaceum]|nr:hypothetical protein FAVG1_12252 [Fusarium avenaceum]
MRQAGGLTNADLATDTTCIPTESDPAVTDQRKPSSKESNASITPEPTVWSIPSTYNSYAPPQCVCRQTSGDAPPPPGSDQELLNVYRKELQILHPFVIIPEGVTAAKLKEARPFLMSSIRMVTSFRSLATTLVGELGLHRSPTVLERTNLMVVKPLQPNPRTNEERRALLGVWYLSSSMSLGFLRIEPMRYTKYIQACLAALEQDQEYDTDLRLITLVRIQHLTERIAQLNSPDDAAEEVAGLPTAPISAYVSAFQSELDRIRNELPHDLRNDRVINIFLNTAMLRLYEPPILDASRISSMSESLTAPTLGAPSALDVFYQSRNALQKFFDDWLSVPVSEFCNQTTPIAAQLVYGLTMLGRWTKLTAPILTKNPIPMPNDTSASNPNVELYKADSEYSASVSPSNATVSVAGSTMGDKDAQAASPFVLREGTDPRLLAAVATLRSKIQTQPGLSLDVTGILSAICSRFEEANASFQVTSAEPGASDHNIWSMSAIKVRITRAKLERWAEIVAAGPGALKIYDDESRDTEMGDRSSETGTCTTVGDAGATMSNNMHADVFAMPDWNSEMPWTSDVLQGVDPSIWFDGYLDWGAVVMSSMGNLEQ